MSKEQSDGSTASYYELPSGAQELQHLISHRNMNAQIGEIFRACYRYGLVSHSDMLRDAKKIKFYAQAEIERLEALIPQAKPQPCQAHSLQPGFSDGELALPKDVVQCPRHKEFYKLGGEGCHECKVEIARGTPNGKA